MFFFLLPWLSMISNFYESPDIRNDLISCDALLISKILQYSFLKYCVFFY